MKRTYIIMLAITLVLVMSACTPESNIDKAPQNTNAMSDAEVERLSTLAKNTEDADELAKYAKSENEGVRSEAAKNPNLSVELQTELTNDPDWIVRNYLGANKRIDTTVAETLAKDEDHRVRWTVAKNPTVPETILTTFVEDESNEVQTKLAENVSISREMMLKIAEKSSPAAVIALLERDNLTDDVLAVIAARPEESIQKALQKQTASPSPTN